LSRPRALSRTDPETIEIGTRVKRRASSDEDGTAQNIAGAWDRTRHFSPLDRDGVTKLIVPVYRDSTMGVMTASLRRRGAQGAGELSAFILCRNRLSDFGNGLLR
jgi:hypothetical protein